MRTGSSKATMMPLLQNGEIPDHCAGELRNLPRARVYKAPRPAIFVRVQADLALRESNSVAEIQIRGALLGRMEAAVCMLPLRQLERRPICSRRVPWFDGFVLIAQWCCVMSFPTLV